jgi:hypothetical protein
MHTTDAVVFVLTRFLLPDADRCIQYCITSGYHMVGLVRDDWGAAMEMLHDGRAEVLVVADPQHLDPHRSPRIEMVSHPPQGGAVRSERSRMVKRTAAR